ncbi:MAG: tail fiber protein [Rhodobacteraceae bacterium]|nr:tail fiber protein [Paracoccaceae bacterium]MCW9041747.1 tail fiber protein [Pseudopelagicola sp.]
MPVTLLTDLAEAKITVAAGSNAEVAITHVALGDGGGAAYDPTHDQTALVNELARLPVTSRIQADSNTWLIKVEFPPETAAFDVYEMGFIDADGDLIALWAGADVTARRTGVVSYLVEQSLNFSRIADGVVIVDAPDDELFEHAAADLVTHALDVTSQTDALLDRRAKDAALARLEADHATDMAQVSRDIAAVSQNMVAALEARDRATALMAPVGMIVPMARTGVPEGWIECDGRALTRADYPALFAAIGTAFGAGDGATTFTLPDLRGEFLRGWDNGRGVDVGREFGSVQADEIKSHTHAIQSNSNDGAGGTYVDAASDSSGTIHSPITGATGGAETRPRNIALKFCIRH